MRFNVTFRSTRSVDFEKQPIGEELASHLAASFRVRGLDVYVGESSDYAYDIEFRERRLLSPLIMLGYVGDGDYEWLIQIHSRVGWFRRLFGWSDIALREKTAATLHEILKQDSQFSEIRWHEQDFGHENWSESPA